MRQFKDRTALRKYIRTMVKVTQTLHEGGETLQFFKTDACDVEALVDRLPHRIGQAARRQGHAWIYNVRIGFDEVELALHVNPAAGSTSWFAFPTPSSMQEVELGNSASQ